MVFSSPSGVVVFCVHCLQHTAHMVNKLSTQNLDQMKVRQLADTKYCQEEIFLYLVSSLTKLKIAVGSLSKLVNSDKEEILSNFFGKWLKMHFKNTECFITYSFIPHKPSVSLY